MTTMLSLILAFMLSIGGSSAASVNPAGCPGDTGIQASIDNSRTINRFFEAYREKTASRRISKKILEIPLIKQAKTQIMLRFTLVVKEELRLMGYIDSMNMYQGFYMNPFNFFDPFGLQLSNSERDLFDIQNQISGLEQAILAAINNPRTKPEQIVNLITVYKAMASQYGKNPKLIFALIDNLDINRDFLFQTDKAHAKEFFDNIIKEIAIQCAFAIGGEILEGILVARAASFLDDAARAATFSDDIVRAGTVSDDIARTGTISDDIAKAGSFSDDVVRTGSVSDDIVRTGSKLRQQYVDEVLALKDKIPTLEKAGMTKEEIAKILYSERNALKIKYRKLTPAKRLEEIENHCLNVYGNKLGPTIEQLRAKGKTWEQIIESATRPGGQDLGF